MSPCCQNSDIIRAWSIFCEKEASAGKKMIDRKHRDGINVKKWCHQHESEVIAQKDSARSAAELRVILEGHEKKLGWLMHERLIHLIVLFITVILVLFSITLLICLPDTAPASLILFIIVFILACFYTAHYFFLENTVQRWYRIVEDIESKIGSL